MALAPIGSQTGDSPKTPTLRQYIQQNGGKAPNRSTVKIIFPPGKYETFTLLTDHGFRVSVDSNSPMFEVMKEQIDGWCLGCSSLVVSVDDVEKVQWSLNIDTDEAADWEVFTWGWKLDLQPKKKRDRNKTATNV